MSALSKRRKSKDYDVQTSEMNENEENVSQQKPKSAGKELKKRVRYSFKEKLAILDEARLLPVNVICEKYKISIRAFEIWKKERLELEEAATSGRTKDSKRRIASSDLDTELYNWFWQTVNKGVPISGPILKQQALLINHQMGGPVNFQASNGWLDKWKSRMKLKNIKVTGEKLSANNQAANKFKTDFADLVNVRNLSRKQIFNMDESGLQFKLTPARTFVPDEVTQASGPKKQLERVTIAACCNADGSCTLPLIVIGKSKNPRCLKDVDKKTDLPVWYCNQSNAWMDLVIYERWFTEQFVPRVEDFLRAQGLPLVAILLVDNCKAHKYLKVREIEVVFFPPNVTSLIQPMDQGILETLKIHYSNRLVDSIVESVSDQFNLLDFLKTVNLRKVIFWIAESWERVSSTTIYKCWKNLWPVDTRDVATQTENSSYILDSLDGSVGTEIHTHPGTENDSAADKLLSLIKSIKGYESVDSSTLLNWLKNDNCRDSHDELSLDSQSKLIETVDPPPNSNQEIAEMYSEANNRQIDANDFSLITGSIDLIYQDL